MSLTTLLTSSKRGLPSSEGYGVGFPSGSFLYTATSTMKIVFRSYALCISMLILPHVLLLEHYVIIERI
jgi:hypothetical protein